MIRRVWSMLIHRPVYWLLERHWNLLERVESLELVSGAEIPFIGERILESEIGLDDHSLVQPPFI